MSFFTNHRPLSTKLYASLLCLTVVAGCTHGGSVDNQDGTHTIHLFVAWYKSDETLYESMKEEATKSCDGKTFSYVYKPTINHNSYSYTTAYGEVPTSTKNLFTIIRCDN